MQVNIFVQIFAQFLILISITQTTGLVKYEAQQGRPISISIETKPPVKLINAPDWVGFTNLDEAGTDGKPPILVLNGVARQPGTYTFDVEDQTGTVTIQIHVTSKKKKVRKYIYPIVDRELVVNPANTDGQNAAEVVNLNKIIPSKKHNYRYKVPQFPQAQPSPAYPPVNPNNIHFGNPLPFRMAEDYGQEPEQAIRMPPKRPRRLKYFSQGQDNDYEVYHPIPPRFEYVYQLDDDDPTTTTLPEFLSEDIAKVHQIKHEHLAASVSFLALLFILFICCCVPLVYYLCTPSVSKAKPFSIRKWIRDQLTPENQLKEENQMPDFEKDYYTFPPVTETTKEQEIPEKPKPKSPKPKKTRFDKKLSDPVRRTSLHIKLKEKPIELSISEVSEVEEEVEYVSDIDDIGRRKRKTKKSRKEKKCRSKSAPTTPMSPMERLKTRFSFGSKSNMPGTIPAKSAKTTTKNPSVIPGFTTEEDEDVIYNRYSGKPINDVMMSKSTERRLNSVTPADISEASHDETDQNEQPESYEDHQEQLGRKPYNIDEESTPSSTDDRRQPGERRLKNNVGQKSSSEEFYKNNMVKWK